MKICVNCGTSNNDDNQFCIGCGQRLEANQPDSPPAEPVAPPVPPAAPYFTDVPPMQQNPPVQPYSYGQPYGMHGYATPVQDTDRMERIRNILSSRLMFAVTIIWFLQVIFAALTAMFGTGGVSNALLETGMSESDIEALSSFLSGFIAVSIVPSILPTLLIGIGLLMIYRSASDKSMPLKPAGVTLIRVVYIIQLVLFCVGIAVAIIIGMLLLGGGLSEIINELPFSGELSVEPGKLDAILGVIGVFIFLAAIIGGAVIIVFNIIFLKFIGSLRETIRTGIAREKFAAAVSVILFILGGFSAFGILGALGSVAVEPVSALLSFASSAVDAAVFFMLGILVNKYKQAVTS